MGSQRGIALMMVISAIMLLCMVILEFVYGTNVNYKIAVNEKERLQAYYLAESAMNLMKVEMKIDKQIRSVIASSPFAQNLQIDLSQPLCQSMPISTGLIRAFFIGGQIPDMAGGEKEQGSGPAKNEVPQESAEKDSSATVFDTEAAQEFLSFEGDFDGSCMDEASKFNFNYFAGLDPAQQTLSGISPYDSYKIMLSNFLKSGRFKKLFDGVSPEKIDETVRNIADWVDKNDVINELGYLTRGPEDSLYRNERDTKPLNAKFLSLEQIHLVEGVDDTWFIPIEDMITVYGDNKVNVCLADDDVVFTLILTYVSQNPNIPSINTNDIEIRRKLIDTVRFGCVGAQPQAGKIAQDLDAALGINLLQPQASSGGFASYITTESRYFSLKLTGQVGETVLNIKAVLDIKDPDPKKWRTLYYKVF